MGIGSNFLSRIISEAKDTSKGFKFDRRTEAMKKSLRDVGGENNFADKIAEVFAMSGLPGMYINKPEVRESVIAAAQSLRSKPARVRSFLALHSALTNFHGVTPVVEGKSEEQELEGNAFQQLVEEVLVSLGLPADMVESGGKPAIKSGLKRTTAKLRGDDQVRSAFIAFARYAGIKVRDGVVGEKKLKAVQEAIDSTEENETSIKDVHAAAHAIAAAIGVDLSNDQLIRVVNESALIRSIKTAARDAKVKRAMMAFLRVLNQ